MASYHAIGAVSEGRPFAIVAMAFCICGSKPLLNLTTRTLGSVRLRTIRRDHLQSSSKRFQIVKNDQVESSILSEDDPRQRAN